MNREAQGKPGFPARRLPRVLNRNFIYDEKHGFILAFVPKAACTNWKTVMRYMAGHADYLDNQLAHDREKGGLRYLDLNGPDAEILDDPAVRKYTCIRNPYSRALSGYLNKIERRIPMLASSDPTDHYLDVTREIDLFRRNFLDLARYPVITFEVFLLFLRDSGSFLRNDEHWQTQTALLCWPHVSFDYIARFENLEADAREVLGQIGCDIAFPSQADVRFPATGATDRLATYLTPTCARLIEQIYAEDFANFGYPLRDPAAG